MVTANCPSRETLRQYSIGLLSDQQSDDLADHLDSCADCQATMTTLDEAEDTLVGRLRMPISSESYLAEPQLQAAVDDAIALPGGGPMTPDASGVDGPPAAALPQTLGEYRVLEELGRGGMGRVYKALHTKLDRMVAIKVLPRGRVGDRQALTRFEREMRAVGRLAHPNIVQAYDAREIDGTPVLIMEFVDGLDLAEIVRRVGPVPLAEACELVRQTALALQCAHEHGLVHRDIKPSNIMLARSGEVKLLDLGLARFYAGGLSQFSRPGDAPCAIDPSAAKMGLSPSAGTCEEMTGTGQAMGTAEYMAPEQASDSRTVDIRADLYSLGCTLYKLLSGRAPFSGPEFRTTLEKMNAHVHQPAPPLRHFAPDVPEELAAVVARLLAKDPADRFATPAAVATVLEPFCAAASPLSLWERVRVRAEQRGDRPNFRGEGNVTSESNVLAAKMGLSPSEERAAPTDGPLSLRERARVRAAAQAAPAPIRHRPILRRIAIGAAFFGAIAAAFFAGVLITIKRDGQTYQVEAPPGSRTTVDEKGNPTLELPAKPEATKPRAVNPAAEVKALQGEWKVVRVEKGNAADSWRLLTELSWKDVVPESLARVRISETALSTYDFKHATNSTFEYRIDLTASPKTIDLLGKSYAPVTTGLSALGIYEIEGDRLKLCLTKYLSSVTSQQRPDQFAVEPTSGNVLLVLERYRPSEEEHAIQGEWWIATRVDDGKVAPEDANRPRQFSLDENVFYMDEVTLIEVRGRSVPFPQTHRQFGLYLNDPSKQPKAITLLQEPAITPGTSPKLLSAAEEFPGIYKLEDDRLTIAYRKGGPPPAGFKSEPGSGVTLLVLQRTKPEEAKPAPSQK